MKKQSKVTNEDLARMVKNGFDGVDEQINDLKINMNSRFDDVNSKLDNVAYRFEMVELEKRVEKLELKLGLKRT